jgi:hypothetical protein
MAEDVSQVIPALNVLNIPSKVIPKLPTNCATCDQDNSKTVMCPAFLKSWSEDDKKNKVVPSNYNSCMSNIKKKLDFAKAKKRMQGIVSNDVLNSLQKCSAEPDHLIAKSAETLLRFEDAQKNLYYQIALMDSFIADGNGLEKESCANPVFPKNEKFCLQLKGKCSQIAQSANDNRVIVEAGKVEAEAQRLEKEIKEGKKSPELLAKNKEALGILKLATPWVFSEKFIEARKNKSEVGIALRNQFVENRKAFLVSLNKIKSTANCFTGNSKDCAPSDFNGLLQLAPTLHAEPVTKASLDSLDSNEWNQNMSAQECVANFAFDRDQTAHTIYIAGVDAVAGLLTMGIGLIPNAIKVLKLAITAKSAATAAEVIVVTANTHFAVEGVQNAVAACSDERQLLALAPTSKDSSKCSLDGRINLGQLSEKGSCLTNVAFAMINGLPLAQVARVAHAVPPVVVTTKIPLTSEATVASTIQATEQRIKDSNEAYLTAAHAGSMKAGRVSYETLDADPAMGYIKTINGLQHQAGVRVADLGGGEGLALANICKILPKDARCLLISLKSHATSNAQTKVFKDRNFDGISEAELRGISTQELALIHTVKDTAEQTRLLNVTGVDVGLDYFGLAAYSGNPAETLRRSLAILKKPIDGKPGGILFEHLGVHERGAVGDFFGKNNLIITKDGEILTYAEWLKTLKGIKAEVYYKRGVHDVVSTEASEGANAKILLVPGEKPVIPELKPLSFRFPNEPSAVVPRGIYMEKGAKPISLPKVATGIKVQAPTISTGVVKDTSAAIITQGNPDKVLSDFAASAGAKGEITINLGHEKTGFSDVTDIISNKGQRRQSLTGWMESIPGIKVTIKRTAEKVQMSTLGKVINKDDQTVEQMVDFTHTYYQQTATIKIKDFVAFKKYMEENPLVHIGNGKPGSDGLPTAMYLAE